MDIFCDSSFLMALVSNPITCQERVEDELGKLKFIVPSSVLKELELIKKRAGPKRSKMAGAAIQMANSRFEITNIGESNYDVDSMLIEYAIKSKSAVATLDNELLRRLIDNNV
jgi:rRNA-processing protein FCF1